MCLLGTHSRIDPGRRTSPVMESSRGWLHSDSRDSSLPMSSNERVGWTTMV